MSTSDTPSGTPTEEAASAADTTPQTPEALMQAASQHIAALEAERDDFKDRWMRAEAEMANVRARAKRDVDETRQFAVQKFARDVAEAAENLRRGLHSIPPPSAGPGADEPAIVAKLREGFEGIERSFVALLERNGIAATDPTGAAFDPNLHQAMAEQETADHPAGTVIQAWSLAWTLNNRLLRPAMVVIAKAPPDVAAKAPPDVVAKLDTTA